MTDHPGLDIESTADGLRVAGEIDVATADELAARIGAVPPASSAIVLDLAGVGFLDSSGLRVLIDAHQRSERQGRRLVLANVTAPVERLLDIAGVVGYLNVE